MTIVHISSSAQKEYKKLPKSEQNKIKRKIALLEIDLVVGKKLSDDLEGFYSIRAWPYRIIYELIKGEIWVVKIKHRKDVYK